MESSPDADRWCGHRWQKGDLKGPERLLGARCWCELFPWHFTTILKRKIIGSNSWLHKRIPWGTLKWCYCQGPHHSPIKSTYLEVEPRHLHFLLRHFSWCWRMARIENHGDGQFHHFIDCILCPRSSQLAPGHSGIWIRIPLDFHPGQSEFRACVLSSPVHCLHLGKLVHGMKSGPAYNVPGADPWFPEWKSIDGSPSSLLGTL